MPDKWLQYYLRCINKDKLKKTCMTQKTREKNVMKWNWIINNDFIVLKLSDVFG